VGAGIDLIFIFPETGFFCGGYGQPAELLIVLEK
jgi:hypothetical protein